MSLHYLSAYGAVPPPVEETVLPTACPECSYLEGGTCHWCPNGSDLPGCQQCVDHKRPPEPWYKTSAIVVPVLIGVGTSVLAAVVTTIAMRHMKR